MTNRKKIKVLENLLKVYNHKNSGQFYFPDNEKGSLIQTIESETKIDRDTLDLILSSLESDGYVTYINQAIGIKLYTITIEGKNAIYNNTLKLYSYNNFLQLTPVIISFIALIVSIVALFLTK